MEKRSRRNFIKLSGSAGIGLTLLPHPLSVLSSASPSNKLVIAVMGVRSRGKALAVNFARQAETEVAYVCDVDERYLGDCIKSVSEVQPSSPKGVKDFRKILEVYDSPDTFFFLDPPYHKDTRKDGRYRHEMSRQDHRELVGRLLSIKGKAMLSGYKHPDYSPLEKNGWHRIDHVTTCMAVGKTRSNGLLGKGSVKKKHRRVESLWLNYEIPEEAKKK